MEPESPPTVHGARIVPEYHINGAPSRRRKRHLRMEARFLSSKRGLEIGLVAVAMHGLWEMTVIQLGEGMCGALGVTSEPCTAQPLPETQRRGRQRTS